MTNRKKHELQRSFIFDKRKAKLPLTRQEVIYGADHIFQQLEIIFNYILDSLHAFRDVSIDSGAVFWGPHGVGKTMFARYVATKSKARFIDMKKFPVEIENGRERYNTIKESILA